MRYFVLLLLGALSSAIFAQITPHEAVENMGRGINMGNTMEPPSYGEWAGKAKEYYFEDYKTAGFSTVRLPVRWYPYTENNPPYKISDEWLDIVEQNVDWALERGFYVIINCHHSDPIKEDYEANKAKWDSIWVQISERFQHKSEKLFFEILNEPRTHTHTGLTMNEINEMNERILGIIRKTNPTRIVIYAGNGWSSAIDLMNDTLRIPDPADPYLMGTYHSYDPYEFGLEGRGTWGSEYEKIYVANTFKNVSKWSKKKGIPVLLGEFGSTYVNDDGGESDLNSRYRHYACYVENAIKNNIAFTVWDDNGWFQVYRREEREWKEWKDILIHYSPESTTNFLAEIQDDSTILLTWKNQASEFDSVTIERKIADGTYATIAKVEPGVTTYSDDAITVGNDYLYRLITHQKDTAASWGYPQQVKAKPEVRSYYIGKPLMIPGNVEAEFFDKGVEGLTFHDTDIENQGGELRLDVGVDIEARTEGGYQIAYIDSGEWLEYTIDVQKATFYDVQAHVASLEEGAKFNVIFEKGRPINFTAPATGSWQTTTIVTGRVRLPEGQQIMRVLMKGELFNLDKLVFSVEGESAVRAVEASQVRLYPNPSEGVIHIESPAFQFNHLEVLDLRGILVYQQIFPEYLMRSSVSFASNQGVYFVKLGNDEQHIIKKLILN